ncbi:kinase-like domain-containing protein, partial [Catenaria anguillulae PL171]
VIPATVLRRDTSDLMSVSCSIATLAKPLFSTHDEDTVVIKQVFTDLTLNKSNGSSSSGSVSPAEQAKAEIQILAMLKHPNIIEFNDCASYMADQDAQGRQVGGQLCWVLVMEYANSGNLHEFLTSQEQPLDDLTISSFTGQLLLALHYIHSQNILHRDLKSHNVLLSLKRRPQSPVDLHPCMFTLKLADFGIARLFVGANVSANTVIGTPNYLSPELCQGDQYDEKSDIWAMGCILFELATRQFMFDAPNLLALTRRIIEYKPSCEVPATAPAVLKILIPKMTDPNRVMRLHMNKVMDMSVVQKCIVDAVFHNLY